MTNPINPELREQLETEKQLVWNAAIANQDNPLGSSILDAHFSRIESVVAKAITEARIDELKSAYTTHPGIDTEYLDHRIAELTTKKEAQ